MNTDSHELPPEAYLREIRNLDRTAVGTDMDKRGESVPVAYPMFQSGGGGSIPTSPLQLCIESIDFGTAKDLNRLWHSRLPRIGDPTCIMRAAMCYAAGFDERWYASAIWTHPVNRSLPQVEWLELRRLAISPQAPKNTASRMLSIMAKIIRKERPEVNRLISYQDKDVHTGGIYKAAGWKATIASEYTSWTNAKRTRPKDQSTGDKQRWELEIRPCATAATPTADPADQLKETTAAMRAEGGKPMADAPNLLSVFGFNN